MKCNVCGRQPQNEEANFCDYCGASFREQAHSLSAAPTVPMLGRPVMEKTVPFQRPINIAQSEQKTEENVISFGNWFSIYILLLVPVVGWLAFIIMLFVWAFDNKTPASKKNWARVTLIFTGILIMVLLSYLIEFISSPEFQKLADNFYNNFY